MENPGTRARILGDATDYQKSLVTLREQIFEEHTTLHLERKMAFGGHINLPPSHEFMHAATDLLHTLLTVNLSNTFKELSGEFDYYISPAWKVCVVKPRMEPAPRKKPYRYLNDRFYR